MRVLIDDKIIYVSPFHSVGISIVILDSQTLEIIFNDNFDTYSSPIESDKLENIIKSCSKNHLIILGIVV